jgi:hypothetical protein
MISLRGVLACVGFQDPQHFCDRLGVLMRTVARRDDVFALRAVRVQTQYGTTPTLEFGESRRPRSPMIVLYRTPGVIGIVSIALITRFLGERESTLDLEATIALQSPFFKIGAKRRSRRIGGCFVPSSNRDGPKRKRYQSVNPLNSQTQKHLAIALLYKMRIH